VHLRGRRSPASASTTPKRTGRVRSNPEANEALTRGWVAFSGGTGYLQAVDHTTRALGKEVGNAVLPMVVPRSDRRNVIECVVVRQCGPVGLLGHVFGRSPGG